MLVSAKLEALFRIFLVAFELSSLQSMPDNWFVRHFTYFAAQNRKCCMQFQATNLSFQLRLKTTSKFQCLFICTNRTTNLHTEILRVILSSTKLRGSFDSIVSLSLLHNQLWDCITCFPAITNMGIEYNQIFLKVSTRYCIGVTAFWAKKTVHSYRKCIFIKPI